MRLLELIADIVFFGWPLPEPPATKKRPVAFFVVRTLQAVVWLGGVIVLGWILVTWMTS